VDNPPNNGAVLTIATIIKAVMSSAAEAELGALFLNAREAVYLRQILTEMGHPQPRTPIQTDNSTAEGVINNKIQPKRTKAMDMRFHWLRCREAQEQIRVYWRPGKTNLADYFTKHHPPMHHVNVRSEFLTKVKDLAEARRQREELGQTKSKFHKS
jgi:ABC-type sulfate transport system substrate-binding protein